MFQDIVTPRSYDAGQYYSGDSGVLVPRGTNQIRVRVFRGDPSWDRDRSGDGRPERVGIRDRLTEHEHVRLVNRDECLRVMALMSRDGGDTWQRAGMIGTRAGRKLKRGAGDPWGAAPTGAPAEWSRLWTHPRIGDDEDVLVRFVVDVCHPIFVTAQYEFARVELPIFGPATHNSVAHNDSATGALGTDTTTTDTGTLDNTTGDDRCVVINAAAFDASAVQTVTGDWNSQSMTGDDQTDSGSVVTVYTGHQVEADGADATTTDGNVTVPSNHDYLITVSRALSGVDQTTPVDTKDSDAGTGAISLDAANMTADDMSIDICLIGATTITQTASQANYHEAQNFSDGDSVGTGTLTGTGTVTHTYDNTGGAPFAAHVHRFIGATEEEVGEPPSAWGHTEHRIVRTRHV